MSLDQLSSGGKGRGRRTALAALAGAVFAVPLTVRAGVGYTSGSATITHDANISSATPPNNVYSTSSIPASSSMPVYQLNSTITSGTSTSTGKGSIGHVTNSTTATFTVPAGTGVTQNDPTHIWASSSLLYNINQMKWTPSTTFGPVSTGYFSIAVGGTVGTGGSAQFIANLNFTDSYGNALRSPISFNQTWNTAGAFAQTFTSSSIMLPSGSVTYPNTIRLSGTIEFRANNDGEPSDIAPTDWDVGSAPPTATFVNNSTEWNNPQSWSTDILATGIPNQIGNRARFSGGASVGTQTVIVAQPTPFGTLDVDYATGSGLTITGNTITLGTQSDNGVIQHRNVQGNSALNINNTINLASPLQVVADSMGGVHFNGNLSGNSLIKDGAGPLFLNAAFSGPSIAVNNGTFVVGGTGSISPSVSTIELNNSATIDTSGRPGPWILTAGQVVRGIAGNWNGLVQVNAGAAVDPGSPSAAGGGTLNFNNGVAFSGGTFRFDLTTQSTTGAGVNDFVSVGAPLIVNGGTVVANFTALPGPAGTVYHLINSSGTTGGGTLTLINNSRATAHLNPNASGLDLVIDSAASAGTLTWTGSGSGNWDVHQTTPWLNNSTATPDNFFNGDIVVFDSTATNRNVNIVQRVFPGGILVNNDSGTVYTFFGAGTISGGTTSLTKNGAGQLTITNSNDFTGGVTVNAGMLVANNLSNGPLLVKSGATAKISAKAAPNAVSGTTLLPSLQILGGGVFDVTNNAVAVDYSGASPINTIRLHLLDHRLISSAGTPAGAQIGYGEASTVLGAGGGVWYGKNVDDTAVVTKITYGGDANLDGQVDVTDLGTLATNWQTSGATWVNADFNYDGLVNVSDLGILATGWQLGVGSPLGPGSFDAAMASLGLGGVSVPEPTIVSAAILAPIMLLRRRRL